MIAFLLSNFTLTCLLLGLVISGFILLTKRPAGCGDRIEAFFMPFLLCSVGLSFLYNFVMHVFFADMAAAFIGWANSPFQYEVGFASLGFGLVGLAAIRRDPGLRFAAVLGITGFLWGAAGGHIYQMITAHNFAPGNAGIVFWTDIFTPVIGWSLWIAQYRSNPCRTNSPKVPVN